MPVPRPDPGRGAENPGAAGSRGPAPGPGPASLLEGRGTGDAGISGLAEIRGPAFRDDPPGERRVLGRGGGGRAAEQLAGPGVDGKTPVGRILRAARRPAPGKPPLYAH